MKRILILCYDYPPLNSVGGQRPHGWFKYLHQFGFQTTLITRNWSPDIKELSQYFEKDGERIVEETNTGTTIRAPYPGNSKSKSLNSGNPIRIFSRKLGTVLEHIFKWYRPASDDKHFLYLEAKKYVQENEVDMILVTGEPFILFKYAHQLSKEFGIPWIADYRDGWSTDHAIKNGVLKLLQRHEERLERKYLSNVLFASSASEYIATNNSKLFPNIEQYVHPNGIDLSLVTTAQERQEIPEKFTLTFTGTIYDAHNVEDFLSGLDMVIDKFGATDINVRFIGIELRPSSASEKVLNYAANHPDVVHIIAPMPHQEAVQQQVNSHVLIKFDYTGQHNALLGSKLYEYAATQKPIITVLSIEEKRTTFFPNRNVQYMTTNAQEVADSIASLYLHYKKGEVIKSDLTASEILSFSREKSIEAFAAFTQNKLSEL